ncbi:hypothetical protein [Streptomyces sp. SID14446]|uniref:hypothetical protein n=1 Tax=Streptomyces sp. SID14446 TaxID=2706072 RepID=UPI001941CC2D|nr:hypothetical protein [Streptomyces sp. SID14446]
MGDGERETWTTDEFGSCHTGAVGVLLADGTVPPPAFFDANSGAGGQSVSQWTVYDGRTGQGPRAAALRAVCSCGWTGPEQYLDWKQIGTQDLQDAGADAADTCMQDWDTHSIEVERSAIPLPEPVTVLLAQLEVEIEKLAKSSPLAAVRAARRLEVLAMQTAYWPAHEARRDAAPGHAAAALGLDESGARMLLARFGRWSPYH